MKHGKSINIFLMDGIVNGRWMCELSNWTEEIVFISKDDNFNKAHIKITRGI